MNFEGIEFLEEAIESVIVQSRAQRAIAYLDYRASQMEQDILNNNPSMAPYLHQLNSEIIKSEQQGYLNAMGFDVH